MANTYSQLLYHVIFSTKNRAPILDADHRTELFQYAWGIHKNHHCHLYRIGGVADHIHVLTHLPTTLSVADYVRELKTGTSKWIKQQNVFQGFDGWQDGYGVFTESYRHKDMLIEYIKRQEEHHQQESYLDEYRRLLHEAGIVFDEKYLTKRKVSDMNTAATRLRRFFPLTVGFAHGYSNNVAPRLRVCIQRCIE